MQRESLPEHSWQVEAQGEHTDPFLNFPLEQASTHSPASRTLLLSEHERQLVVAGPLQVVHDESQAAQRVLLSKKASGHSSRQVESMWRTWVPVHKVHVVVVFSHCSQLLLH